MTIAMGRSSRNLTKPSDHRDWIVCGWFTDDAVYRGFAENLAASLDRVGAPYDLVATEPLSGNWEANTRAKPAQMLAAMDRHPDKTVIFMDVDYTAVGDLAPLAQMRGDVALKIGARRRPNGSTRITASAQIMVLKQNAAARRFIETWLRRTEHAHPGDTTEAFLSLTIGCVHDCAIARIDSTYVDALLRHHWASRHTTRMPGFGRGMMYLLHWAVGQGAPRDGARQ